MTTIFIVYKYPPLDDKEIIYLSIKMFQYRRTVFTVRPFYCPVSVRGIFTVLIFAASFPES